MGCGNSLSILGVYRKGVKPMRKFNFSAVLIVALLGACSANLGNDAAKGHDTFETMLTNTMRVVSQDGGVQNWFFNRDGSLDSLEDVTGTWEFDGNELCTVYGERTKPGCWVVPRGKTVGDSWELVVGSGKVLEITIVQGR